MLRRALTLFSHPAFRARPLRLFWRCVRWLCHVALRRPAVFPLVPGGPRVTVPPTLGYTPVATYVLRGEAEPELALLDRWIRPGDTFVDVGANIGIYTVRAAPVVGRAGRVISIEPGAAAFASLQANLALNDLPQVTTVRTALSDTVGTVRLYHTAGGSDPQAFSLIADPSAAGAEEVPVTTLDALAATFGLARLDCLKIDVEGVEEKVIAGAEATIRRFRPTILMEVNTRLLPRDVLKPRAAWDRLTALGYRFHRLDERGREEPLPDFPAEFCNVIGQPAETRT